MDYNNIPAGRYFIGDPCYAFNDAAWQEVLEKTSEFTAEGFPAGLVGGIGTGSDGCFNDSYGNEYPVDSGNLGFVHVDLISAEKMAELVALDTLGRFVDFPVEWAASDLGDGEIAFGDNIVIDTKEEDEWDPSDEWESSDEEDEDEEEDDEEEEET